MGSGVTKPLVGVTCCLREIDKYGMHVVNNMYIHAVDVGADAIPVNVPALGSNTDIDGLLDRLDGLVFTGSPSNVAPEQYGGPAFAPEIKSDPARDATTLPLIMRALDRGIPLLAICRGIQELNVALGGTLHQHVAQVEGRFSHFPDPALSIAERFDIAHPIDLTPDGLLAGLLGQQQIGVNSIHVQGIDRLADGLAVEAKALDGQIEAVRVPDAPGFNLGMQWHPEYAVETDPNSIAIFKGFARVLRGGSFMEQQTAAAE